MRLRNSFSSAALPRNSGRSPNLTTQSSVKPASNPSMFHGMNRDSTWATKARASSAVRGLWPAIRRSLYRVAQLGHDPERALAAGDALAIVERVAPALRVVVPGRAGGVRAEDRVLQGEEPVVGLWRLLDHDVDAGGHNDLIVERVVERVLVDHRAAAGVD